jgi:hypothetical protein
MAYSFPQSIDTLPNNGIDVILMRRTGNNTVACAVGCRRANMEIDGWTLQHPPTHWTNLPPFPGSVKRNGE